MTIKAGEWYRAGTTRQYCEVQRIPSTTNPRVSVRKADEDTRGFEVALVWYSSSEESPKTWTKRVLIMNSRKAAALLREPNKEDQRTIARLKKISATLPISSASRDGEFTMPV